MKDAIAEGTTSFDVALKGLLDDPDIVSKLYLVISSGKYRDSFDYEIGMGGHKDVGRMRQCERAVSTVLANRQDTDPDGTLHQTFLLWDAMLGSVARRFDSHSRYDIWLEYGFLVTKWTASPSLLNIEEDPDLRRMVYVSDGIMDMDDLRKYIEHKYPWIIDVFARLNGLAFIEPNEEVSGGETIIGSMLPDMKNLYTLLGRHYLFYQIRPSIYLQRDIADLEDSLQECLKLAWGRGGNYAVRKGNLVVSL